MTTHNLEHTSPKTLHNFLRQPFSQIAALDGGATKTSLELLDRNGQPIQKPEIEGPLNLHESGEEEIQATLKKLTARLDREKTIVVVGAASAERKEENRTLHRLFAEAGFFKTWIEGDGDLLLQAISPTGLVLIGGTGSHCMGIDGPKKARAGGLGRILGDEGSGYWIGLEAIRAVLAERYSWGDSTTLLTPVIEHFKVDDPEELLHPINGCTITKREIAALAPLVISESNNDLAANKIVNNAVKHLVSLTHSVLQQLNTSETDLHLVGGLFSSEKFKQQFLNASEMSCIDLSDEHPVAWAIRKLLR